MWPQPHSHPQHTALAFFFCMSVTRLLSECQTLYDWNYDGTSIENTQLQNIRRRLTVYPSFIHANRSLDISYDAQTPKEASSGRLSHTTQRAARRSSQRPFPQTDHDDSPPRHPAYYQSPPPYWLSSPDARGLPGGQDQDHQRQSWSSAWLSLREAGHPNPGPERPLFSDRLSPQEALVLRERLKGLYALLKSHPALMDRRLQVGSEKPHVPPAVQQPHLQEKRSFTHLYSREVCPSRTEWRLLRGARDINNTQVQIFQPHDGSTGHQWFYTTTCLHDSLREEEEEREADSHFPGSLGDCPTCCNGINTRRYHSHCMTKTSLMMALVRKANEEQFDWNWIQVNSSCSCYISPI